MTTYIEEHYNGKDFSYVNWSESELRNCTFTSCRFRGAQLAGALTTGSQFIDCDFTGAVLNGSIHTRSAFTNCRFTGVNLFAAIFEECKMVGTDFTNVLWDGITINGGDWSYTNLRHANFTRQDLRSVRFMEADLTESKLEKADLRGADLTRTNLTKTKLAGADLRGADMSGVNFKALDLAKVRIDMFQAVAFAKAYGAKID